MCADVPLRNYSLTRCPLTVWRWTESTPRSRWWHSHMMMAVIWLESTATAALAKWTYKLYHQSFVINSVYKFLWDKPHITPFVFLTIGFHYVQFICVIYPYLMFIGSYVHHMSWHCIQWSDVIWFFVCYHLVFLYIFRWCCFSVFITYCFCFLFRF